MYELFSLRRSFLLVKWAAKEFLNTAESIRVTVETHHHTEAPLQTFLEFPDPVEENLARLASKLH